MTPSIDAATLYHSRGWVPIPIPRGSKAPTFPGWQRVTRDTALSRFNGEAVNIGILLGEPSGGLVDLDLDCPEAIALANSFLPASLTFGRASRPRSHRFFLSANCPTEKFVYDTGDGRTTLLELRANGGLQTVVPSSVHPSGEVIEFDDPAVAPVSIAPDDLLLRARGLAVAALLVREGFSPEVATRAALDLDASIVDGLPDRVADPVRRWLGFEPTPVAVPRRVIPINESIKSLVERWNADHRRDYPRHSSECPVCGSDASFGHLPDDPSRWHCFSTNHPDGIGIRGEQGFHGDALDLEAAARGVKPIDVLRADGYLKRADPPPARAAVAGGYMVPISPEPSPSAEPWRPWRARSYLTTVDLIRRNERDILSGRVLELNEMTGRPELGRKPLTDVEVTRIRSLIEQRFVGGVNDKKQEIGMQQSKDDIACACDQVAAGRSYNPLREYLDSLSWDGIERISALLEDVLNTERTIIGMAMIRRFFISAVARALNPGCKVDTVLILCGRQGVGKSTFFRILAGEWFVDTAVDLRDKDSFQVLRGAWLYEWAELEALNRARDSSAAKAFLSSPVDRYRPPYGRLVIDVPRTCVIVGSTNKSDFLEDETGNRRFWPLLVKHVEVELLQKWRDQLWAEAVALFRQGESWWLTAEETTALVAQQVDFQATDAWEQRVLEMAVSGEFSTTEILRRAIDKEVAQWDDRDMKRVAKILRRAGFENPRPHRGPRVWRKV